MKRMSNKATQMWILLAFAMKLACTSRTAMCETRADLKSNQRPQRAVVYLLLDGFRYDYIKIHHAKHIETLAHEGTYAPDGMRPSYPTVSYPNYYTLATGLLPEHHGIVGNEFFDPKRGRAFSFHDPTDVIDGSWFSGRPLWSQAEEHGILTGCIAWVGCNATIAGHRPKFYLSTTDSTPARDKVNQIVRWLELPPEERPRLIMAAFPETDIEGHHYRPESQEVDRAVHLVDEAIGDLVRRVRKISPDTVFVVVADHGMQTIQGPWVDLDKFVDLRGITVSQAKMYPGSDADAERLYAALRGADPRFTVFRRGEMPERLRFDGNPRQGDPIIVPTGAFQIRAIHPKGESDDHPGLVASHGYDPYVVPQMNALFVVAGPGVRMGGVLNTFDNVDVFSLIANLLGFNGDPNDGSFQVFKDILTSH